MDNIVLPSKPKIVSEDGNSARFEIDGFYPGYGHTIGNSLRRIILSSLPGAAITSIKVDGVNHEFSTIEGVKEDVITILLNLKKIRIKMETDEPQMLKLSAKGKTEVTAGDIEVTGQVEIVNPDLHIADITNSKTDIHIELMVERGLGYVPKEVHQKEKVDIGTIALDAIFSPIRRVNYEVEKMRVGDRTDFNRLSIFIETDGTITPKEVLEQSIVLMIKQLKAIVGFQEEEEEVEEEVEETEDGEEDEGHDAEILKTRIESLGLPTRTENALIGANIRTVGGLVRKSASDLLNVEGIGKKGVDEIVETLDERDISLKEDE
ncbi:MAG: DNA-directed RNA polymerase subunit alpha [Candidatus Paceibacterota bacterium]